MSVQQPRRARTYRPSDDVDFVIVGSGAAGGILARELSTAGHSVVVLEQGPRLEWSTMTHDEYAMYIQRVLANDLVKQPQTFRPDPDAPTRTGRFLSYASIVGGSNAHFTANQWRFRPIDFNEASRHGTVAGSALVDWPISYDELEPYYTRVEWEIGISGAPGPNDPPRSKPYPMPPLPVKSSGVLMDRGAAALGWHSQVAPMAINSVVHNGRPPCMQCGFCLGFLCEFGAKGTSMIAMLPLAEATGRCEVRPRSYVIRVETDTRGRARGVTYVDEAGRAHLQRAKAVILSANGAETPRLLLNSASSRAPHGLANSSGVVGKHLMLNTSLGVNALFEHPLNEYKGVQSTRILMDFYDSDPRRGYCGGGGIDARFGQFPITFAMRAMVPGTPKWGEAFARGLAEQYTRVMAFGVHGTSLPVPTNSVSLDPDLKDAWGLPAMRVTYRDHPDDLKNLEFLVARARELGYAAGAREVWHNPVAPQTGSAHLLGTCRMGNDPETSVIDRFHRTHDVRNLFICDGSSLVTSGRGQPTMTISALAFRAGEHIARFARRGEI